ncbi:hypothetical protein BN2476_700009 [Paraburkholderia piptadeniae]|uniref:Uncharacterized protein n=1 Tax=Paraburkholderia piptadeniae TaxID=1701573 RepID=A0A1N7SRT6_9BURK|nr:hypothetical protein BN2476_700009 [Paraburkholderia piptadeniae]
MHFRGAGGTRVLFAFDAITQCVARDIDVGRPIFDDGRRSVDERIRTASQGDRFSRTCTYSMPTA